MAGNKSDATGKPKLLVRHKTATKSSILVKPKPTVRSKKLAERRPAKSRATRESERAEESKTDIECMVTTESKHLKAQPEEIHAPDDSIDIDMPQLDAKENENIEFGGSTDVEECDSNDMSPMPPPLEELESSPSPPCLQQEVDGDMINAEIANSIENGAVAVDEKCSSEEETTNELDVKNINVQPESDDTQLLTNEKFHFVQRSKSIDEQDYELNANLLVATNHNMYSNDEMNKPITSDDSYSSTNECDEESEKEMPKDDKEPEQVKSPVPKSLNSCDQNSSDKFANGETNDIMESSEIASQQNDDNKNKVVTSSDSDTNDIPSCQVDGSHERPLSSVGQSVRLQNELKLQENFGPESSQPYLDANQSQEVLRTSNNNKNLPALQIMDNCSSHMYLDCAHDNQKFRDDSFTSANNVALSSAAASCDMLSPKLYSNALSSPDATLQSTSKVSLSLNQTPPAGSAAAGNFPILADTNMQQSLQPSVSGNASSPQFGVSIPLQGQPLSYNSPSSVCYNNMPPPSPAGAYSSYISTSSPMSMPLAANFKAVASPAGFCNGPVGSPSAYIVGQHVASPRDTGSCSVPMQSPKDSMGTNVFTYDNPQSAVNMGMRNIANISSSSHSTNVHNIGASSAHSANVRHVNSPSAHCVTGYAAPSHLIHAGYMQPDSSNVNGTSELYYSQKHALYTGHRLSHDMSSENDYNNVPSGNPSVTNIMRLEEMVRQRGTDGGHSPVYQTLTPPPSSVHMQRSSMTPPISMSHSQLAAYQKMQRHSKSMNIEMVSTTFGTGAPQYFADVPLQGNVNRELSNYHMLNSGYSTLQPSVNYGPPAYQSDSPYNPLQCSSMSSQYPTVDQTPHPGAMYPPYSFLGNSNNLSTQQFSSIGSMMRR